MDIPVYTRTLEDAKRELLFLFGPQRTLVLGYPIFCSQTFFKSLSIKSSISILLSILFSKLEIANLGLFPFWKAMPYNFMFVK